MAAPFAFDVSTLICWFYLWNAMSEQNSWPDDGPEIQ